MGLTAQERVEMLAFCRADRDYLLAELRRRFPFTAGLMPAAMLEDVIQDVLGMRLVPRYLSGNVLGLCHFPRRVIHINQRIASITLPNTRVSGVINSTLAHELAHVRLDHERELRDERDAMTLSLFETAAEPVEIVCYRNWDRNRRLSPAERLREAQADFYASVYLVPERHVLEQPEGREIHEAWLSQGDLSSRRLWKLVLDMAERFDVTGALMARRLEDMGWLVRRERALAVREQAWLPLGELVGT